MNMEASLLEILRSPEIISVALTAVIGAISTYLASSSRIVWGISHGFTFLVPNQQQGKTSAPTPINTGSVFVQNLGRKTAENIEVILAYRPQHFEVWPVLNYEVAETPDRHFIVKIKNLGHREYATIELFSANNELPLTLRVRSPLGEAKKVNFAPMRVMPRWFNRSLILLVLLGLCALTYILIRLIEFISTNGLVHQI
jgi:hypothetical protein